jgi:protein TonB
MFLNDSILKKEGIMRITKLLIFILFLSFANSGICNNYGQQGNEYLAFADQMPEPVGGLSTIYSKIEYPEIAKRAGVEGKVYVLAFINEDGGVDDVKVIKGLGGGCDEATIDAVKQTKFTPGKAAGKAAKIKLSLQIQFKLS